MPIRDANNRNLRLPRELAGQLKDEAAAQGISENTYLIQAARQKVEADRARRKELGGGERPKAGRPREAPRGLGLRLEPLSPPQPQPPPDSAPPPVVVNVGPAAGAAAVPGEGLVAGLARFVASKPPYEQDRRRREAREILAAHGQTAAEQQDLLHQLDQALAEERRKRPQGLGGRTPQIGSLFR